MKGFTGKILLVDLSSGKIEEQNIPNEIYENLLSGVGLGAYVLYNAIPRGADPLGPDNVLGFVSGLLTGTGSLMTGRWLAVCKSPLTGGWGDANCGGTLSPAIKQCGYDGIFFKGIAEKPTYLYVDNKGAQLRDASHIWGKDAVEAEDLLAEECKGNKTPQIAVIGTAGENVSLISGISNDHGRMAARSGVGAVMGSKMLKGVVLAGTKPIKCANPDAMKMMSKEFADKIRKQNLPKFVSGGLLAPVGILMGKMKNVAPLDGIMTVGILKKWGTNFNNTLGVTNGDSPLKNWGGSVVDYKMSKYKKINPDLIRKKEYKKYHCYSCPVGCGGICEIKDITKGQFSHTHKPEYETVCAFGGLLLNDDLNAILYINELLNRAGMDTISVGNTVAFAIECYENGLLTKDDTDGLELNWGNSQAIIELTKKMINREGIGELLADGSKCAAERIGKGSEKYAIHAGGQEPGMHDPRYDPPVGVHYSADPTPGRHTIGSALYYNTTQLWQEVSWAPKVKKYKKTEEYLASDEEALKSVAGACYKQLLDGVGGCLFAMTFGIQHWNIMKMLNAATEWNKTADEYMEIGMKMQTIRQMFNIKHGINPINNIMHKKIAGYPLLKNGPLKDRSFNIDEMVELYWKHFGWDQKTGVPKEKTIKSLGLDNILKEEYYV